MTTTMTISISPDDLKNWPVLDEEPDDEITVWLEFDEDFLGYRIPVKFPKITRRGQTVFSTNTPIQADCKRSKTRTKGWWIFKYEGLVGNGGWPQRGFELWSDVIGGEHMGTGRWDDDPRGTRPFQLYAGDAIKIHQLKLDLN